MEQKGVSSSGSSFVLTFMSKDIPWLVGKVRLFCAHALAWIRFCSGFLFWSPNFLLSCFSFCCVVILFLFIIFIRPCLCLAGSKITGIGGTAVSPLVLALVFTLIPSEMVNRDCASSFSLLEPVFGINVCSLVSCLRLKGLISFLAPSMTTRLNCMMPSSGFTIVMTSAIDLERLWFLSCYESVGMPPNGLLTSV